MELTEREERALLLLRDIQRVDMDRRLIFMGDKKPTDLGFKTNIIQKANNILDTKLDFYIQQLRELLKGELQDNEEDSELHLEKTRYGGITKSI